MSEQIPKTYISSVAAAREFKKTNDYVALLCRRQNIRGVFINGQWYVDPASLAQFLEQKANEREARHKELSQQLSQEYVQNKVQHSKFPAGPLSLALGSVLLFGTLVFGSTLHPPHTPAGFAAVSSAESPFFGSQPPSVTIHSGDAFAGASKFFSGVFATLFGSSQPSQNILAEKSSDLLPPAGQTFPQNNSAPAGLGSASTSNQMPRMPEQNFAAVPQNRSESFVQAPSRVVIQQVAVKGVSEDELTSRLEDLYNRLAVQLSNLQNPGRESPLQNFVVPAVVNNLSNVRLNGTSKADDITSNTITSGTLSISGTSNFSGSLSAATTTLASLTVSGNTTLANATSTNVFSTTASSTNLFSNLASLGALTSQTLTATGTSTLTGLATLANGFLSNASSTVAGGLFTATGGLFSSASSTVGSGAQTGGLTIFGGATTTGNAYFAGGLGVGIATTAAGSLQTSGDLGIGGNLYVTGNSTTLGNSSSNTLTINSSIHSSIVPDQNITYNLGSPSFYWNNVYAGNINANNISAASTTISGTNSATFTINADNVTSDTEDADLIFFRGAVVPNGLLSWKSATKRFEFNQPLFIQNNSNNSLSNITLDLKGEAGQTGALFNVASSTGTSYVSINSNGLTTFGQGFTSQASSTIGSGAQAGGLTINGGATTTGNLVVQGNSTSTYAAGVQATALNLTSATATSTFANGVSLMGGCFQVAGICLGSLVGTQGQVAYFSGTNTAVGTSSLSIATNGTIRIGNNLEIGSSNGNEWFGGVSNASDTFTIGGQGTASNDNARVVIGTGNLKLGGGGSVPTLSTDASTLTFSPAGTNKLDFSATTASVWTFAAGTNFMGGNVGVGTTSPWKTLSVAGDIIGTNITATGTLSVSGASTFGGLISGANASTSLLSVFNDAYFGATATTTITSTGRIGIGTASPSEALQVGTSGGNIWLAGGGNYVVESSSGIAYSLGNSTESSVRFSNNVIQFKTANTERGRFDGTNGYFGLGTTTPGSRLSVQGGTDATVANISASSNNNYALVVQNGGGSGKGIQVNTGSGSDNTATILSANNGVGTNYFTVTNGNSYFQNGFVGIGTTTPNWNLQVAGTRPSLALSDTSAGANLKHWLFSSMGGNLYIGTSTDSFATSSPAALTVLNGGNVGIGTTTPGSLLSVGGAGTGTNFYDNATTTKSGAGGYNITSGCYAINGACIGYTVKLAMIYATTSVSSNTKIDFSGALGATVASTTYSSGLPTIVGLPKNTSNMTVEIWGGGGGGGQAVTAGGGGGGGGAYSEKLYASVSGPYYYTTGSAGVGGTTQSAGGGSCFGTNATACTTPTMQAGGGNPGGNASAAAGPGGGGSGGAASGGDINMNGGGGNDGTDAESQSYNIGGIGGASPRGGLGGGGAVNGAGTLNGTAPGGAGGGNGGNNSGGGGAGAAGGIVITVYATSSPNAAGNDYAEMFPVSNPLIGAGDIVAVDTGIPVSMKLAQTGDDAPLAGVISTAPGQVLGDKDAVGYRPVAFSGRVPVKVNFENGDIHVGDRIALSSIPGVGRKAKTFEASVGIALEDHTQSNASGDTVLVFLDLEQGINLAELGNALDTKLGGIAVGATSTLADIVAATSTASTSPSGFVHSFSTALQAGVQALGTMVVRVFSGAISASVGIFDTIFAREVNTDKLCVTDDTGKTCVTRPQLDSLLAGVATSTSNGSQSSGTGTSTPSGGSTATSTQATSTPPVITLIGADPAQINIGDAYADPGVTVQSTVSPNIGYTMSLDGATSTPPDQFILDTSTAGSHIILYSATDQNGATGTATRTVIINDPNATTTSPTP